MKRQPTEWERIFANDITDKGLISKIQKQLIQLNIKKKKTTTQSKSGQKMYTDISLKGIYTDGQQARGKMLNIFVVTWMDHTK